ncbi:MAG: hypothetical protein P4L99_29295 [Chthoniobacter sp.]|nr:hypothetical protein [Chthoniobacter sp.]
MKFLIVIVLFTFIAHSAFAHVGESPSQIQTRYGPPTALPVAPRKPATDAKVYQKNGIQIRVHYLDGKACLLEFFGINPTDRPEFFKTIEDGGSWSGGIPYNVGGVSTGVAYMRSDGVVARAFGSTVEIFTQKWFDASEAEQRNRIKGL